MADIEAQKKMPPPPPSYDAAIKTMRQVTHPNPTTNAFQFRFFTVFYLLVVAGFIVLLIYKSRLQTPAECQKDVAIVAAKTIQDVRERTRCGQIIWLNPSYEAIEQGIGRNLTECDKVCIDKMFHQRGFSSVTISFNPN